MAYVIAICGAGGKTTLCKKLALKYAKDNKKVCITTTTNMWFDDEVRENFFDIDTYAVGASPTSPICRGELREPAVVGASTASPQSMGKFCQIGKIYYAGHVLKEKRKLTPLKSEEYKKLCDIFDYVIIEADGSRAMPMKIPNVTEPVIPDNVDEIIVVVGMESIGRKIGYICHRFDEFYGKDKFLGDINIEPDTIVDEELIDKFLSHYYVEPLKKRFDSVKINIYKNDYINQKVDNKKDKDIDILFTDKKEIPTKICISLLASGFSKRFGNDNKLLISIPDKYRLDVTHDKLYQIMIDKMLSVKDSIKQIFINDLSVNDINIDIVVVSQYEEILNDINYQNKVTFIKNENASLGLSSSIKLIVSKYKNYDAIIFINADMPLLTVDELTKFIYNSMLNNNKMAAMFTDIPKNPAYFEKEYYDLIEKIDGDKGPREILDNNIKDLYRYYIDSKELFEIDTKEDFEKLKNM